MPESVQPLIAEAAEDLAAVGRFSKATNPVEFDPFIAALIAILMSVFQNCIFSMPQIKEWVDNEYSIMGRACRLRLRRIARQEIARSFRGHGLGADATEGLVETATELVWNGCQDNTIGRIEELRAAAHAV